ncbi:MAG: FAD-dependent oxidoreductase [Verrucomicrobia bacterium]|nr:FAD-dependent oxidoreductase [Verrucomicrobiota bacterium]
MKRNASFVLTLAAALGLSPLVLPSAEVLEPTGSIPVLQDVDVVVVGGASGGVAAALEAAKRGAKVFVAAPRPYLGEDLCATYRLWLEPGEEPATDLAREVFRAAPIPSVGNIGAGLPFKYSADVPSAKTHQDTQPPSLLNDGKWHNAPNQSVQYDGDVTLSVDLGKEQTISKVHVLVYQRPADFEVERVEVAASVDGQSLQALAAIKNDQPGQGQEQTALPLTAAVAAKTRYLKLAVRKTPESKRLLLGELVVEGEAAVAQPVAAAPAARFTTPMQVKRTLDQALIKAGVPFLFGSHATELLRDAQGQPAGVVIANRSGRQAVLAKVIIDATDRAVVARMAGAQFTPYPSETMTFSRIVVGGEARKGDSISLRPRPSPLAITDRKGDSFPVLEYQVTSQMRDGSFASFAELEQFARDWTWTKEAVDGSEVLFQVPPDSFRSRKPQTGAWPGADKLPLECFQPAGVERVFALSGCADVSREAAAALTRPVNFMAVGARLGESVANLARQQPKLEGVRLAGAPLKQPAPGLAHEAHNAANYRAGERTVPAEAHGLPVLGEYDVVVVGGGTGGAPAGIGAGRNGAKTLLIEYLHGLGGVGTMGYIASYYHGNKVGFTKEIDSGVAEFAEKNARTGSSSWNPEHKIEVYRRELRKAGVDIWYGCLGSGAVVENGRVKGVIVLTPQGRGVVLAKMVVDSTGNADIAAAAGAPCRYTDETDVAVQGTGLPPKELGQKYTNTDYTFVDDNDIFDLWRVLVTAKVKFKAAYDLGQLIDTRERRQIVGDFFFTPMDMVLRRTFPDTVVIARSNFDTHGYIIHPMFMLRPPHRDDIDVRVPYRCLLPRGLDRILVTGLGVSAHRDAIPCIRMQADVQNQGYAAGTAAAMIAKKNCATRELDIKELQKHLVAIGNLPAGILTETDSFPLPKERVAEAVAAVGNDFEKLEVVLAQFDQTQPLLREAFAKAETEKTKLNYAHILGMMGDATGAEVLAKAVAAASWDKGWRYTGMGQFGECMSPLDSLIIALGRTKSPLALPPIIAKVGLLETNAEFSHFRAVALALEALADKSAAKPLADLLQKPGLGGHAVTTIDAALESNPPSSTDNTTRNQALTELYLARALYRCGDHAGLGEKTLKRFSQDLHGYYARHAQAVLKAKAGSSASAR